MKKFILVLLSVCMLCLTGCNGVSLNDYINETAPLSAEILGKMSMVNGTAIVETSSIDNQVSVVYENNDVLTFLLKFRSELPSVSCNINYLSSEKKSVDFVIDIIESTYSDGFNGEISDDMREDLKNAIENNSSVDMEIKSDNVRTKISFSQSNKSFNLFIECI